ncbi:endoplasmic reticulum-Golgi intermediate compartment protein 1-like isoform X3 [Salvelinus alpinus]|uniref:endoplasmic reticulum-Golgi intermediate compartment protein 1-like isoform X3 n=1 Tax=Salvelinus alpinus TaxID=8036 RepID=UPI0039FDD630
MWQGLQSITDYKKKTSPVADTDVLLPDKLNNFFARFEDNTVPLTRPATKTCGLSFTVAKVPGNFHVSTHSATAQPQSPDMTHLIHKLAFGEKLLVFI